MDCLNLAVSKPYLNHFQQMVMIFMIIEIITFKTYTATEN